MIKDGPPGRSAMVKWNAATKVFDGVKLLEMNKTPSFTSETYITSYGLIRLCWTASWRPMRDRFSSSRQRMLKGNAPALV